MGLDPPARIGATVDLFDAELGEYLLYVHLGFLSHRAAMVSISTRKPPGNALTSTVERAGG